LKYFRRNGLGTRKKIENKKVQGEKPSREGSQEEKTNLIAPPIRKGYLNQGETEYGEDNAFQTITFQRGEPHRRKISGQEEGKFSPTIKKSQKAQLRDHLEEGRETKRGATGGGKGG